MTEPYNPSRLGSARVGAILEGSGPAPTVLEAIRLAAEVQARRALAHAEGDRLGPFASTIEMVLTLAGPDRLDLSPETLMVDMLEECRTTLDRIRAEAAGATTGGGS